MEMSEDIAIGKWCPYVQIAAGGGQSIHDNRNFNCLGSGCMEWAGNKIVGYCNFKEKKDGK
jgi:hypothetical protein